MTHTPFPHETVFMNFMKGTNKSPKTIVKYLHDVEDFFTFFKGDPLKATKHDLNDFLTHVRESGGSVDTVLSRISGTHCYFAALLDRDLILANPCDGVRRPKKQKKVPKSLTAEDIALLLAFNPTTPRLIRAAQVFKFFYTTGIRVAEMAGMKVGDIDPVAGQARVLGKGNKERVVVIVGGVDKALIEGRDKQEPLFKTDSNHWRGKGMSTGAFRADIKALAKAAGLEKRVWCHLLRASFATHSLNGGCDLRFIQEQLGHSNIQTTTGYTQVAKEVLSREINLHHPMGKKATQ